MWFLIVNCEQNKSTIHQFESKALCNHLSCSNALGNISDLHVGLDVSLKLVKLLIELLAQRGRLEAHQILNESLTLRSVHGGGVLSLQGMADGTVLDGLGIMLDRLPLSLESGDLGVVDMDTVGVNSGLLLDSSFSILSSGLNLGNELLALRRSKEMVSFSIKSMSLLGISNSHEVINNLLSLRGRSLLLLLDGGLDSSSISVDLLVALRGGTDVEHHDVAALRFAEQASLGVDVSPLGVAVGKLELGVRVLSGGHALSLLGSGKGLLNLSNLARSAIEVIVSRVP